MANCSILIMAYLGYIFKFLLYLYFHLGYVN